MHAESKSRAPAVADTFYPGEAAGLRAAVQRYLAGAEQKSARPKALMVPHAGYAYSGPTAGAAYGTLVGVAPRYTRVVLIGPAHRVPLTGLAVPSVDAFRTPLGSIPLDRPAIEVLLRDSAVCRSDLAHAPEHSLEVQLPFLQVALGEFTLVPILAGAASSPIVARVLGLVWGGAETLIVVSSDLSHYHPASAAERLDARTSNRILALDGSLEGENACGCVGLNGFLRLASQRRLRPALLDLRHSGNTAGDRRQVVGYGAYAFHDAES